MAENIKRSLACAVKAARHAADKNANGAWMCDNLYLIERIAGDARGSKKLFSQKRIFALARREIGNGGTDAQKLINAINESGTEFTLDELRAANRAAEICAIIKIGETAADGEGDMPALFKTLFALESADPAKTAAACWAPEKLLLSREPGYAGSDAATKDDYRTRLAEKAKKDGISEYAEAEALTRAGNAGEALFSRGKRPAALWFLYLALSFLPGAFAAFRFFGAAGALLLPPIGAAAFAFADFSASLTVRARRAPRMEEAPVPESARTMVALASLLFGGDGDEKLFDSLERFANLTPDENVFFCLLADLPDSANRYNASDPAVINRAREAIDALNEKYGKRFFLFLRERVLNESEGSFGGYERKRGAVCELVKRLAEAEEGKTGEYGLPAGIKYLLTLDSDTNIGVGTVRELVAAALHPLNAPRAENGRVVKGYGIIQPAMRTELKSAYATAFSRLTSGDIGADRYSSAAYTRGQDIFGEGTFCGKGLIDVELFYKLVCGRLPEGRVLSHDVIEGGIMRTLYAPDISLTDSTPKNPVSYYRRLHRWMRGDFQNLYFLRADFLPRLTKAHLVLSVLRHLCPVFSLLAVFFCSAPLLYGAPAFFAAYGYLFVPDLLFAVRYVLRGGGRAVYRYFSNTLSQLSQTAARTAYELCSSCRQAILALHAFALAGRRMRTHKRTLEWTTAAQAEKLASGLGKYVLDGAFSLAVGSVVIVFAAQPFAKLAGLAFLVYPLVSAYLSRPIDGGRELSPHADARRAEILKAHAADMWRFFADNVSERTHWLPPDNVQLSPVAATAYRTSPTNIGFYLVSVMAANDFGFIGEDEMLCRLENAVSSVEALEKHRGVLYNWYDLTGLSVIGDRFVSSVDGGNFAAMLSALRQGLLERGEDGRRLALAARCGRLLEQTDLSALYDSERELFYIGVNDCGEPAGDSHYDMLMSEMRLTSYYALASGEVPKKHWRALGRAVTSARGHIGMFSWSGTAFEYLMPQLFMPAYRDSFICESVLFALAVQRAEHRIWGISESACYLLDSEMHYRYKANGVQKLALRKCGSDENVVSPYSAYMAAQFCPKAAVRNLEKLAAKGMYGKYGMYEAFDNSCGGLAVKCYMAHHVGMSIVAALNACTGGIFIKRFMREGRLCAASGLLTEPVPAAPSVYRPREYMRPGRGKRPAPRASIGSEPDPRRPRAAFLNRGDLTAVISDSGTAGLYRGEIALAYADFSPGGASTPRVLFMRGEETHCCTPGPGGEKPCAVRKYGFERGRGFVSHIAAGGDFSGRVKYGISRAGCFVIETRAEAVKKYDVALAFEPVLEPMSRFLAHVAFSRLFVESEYDKSENILYFHRRGSDGGRTATLAVAAREKRAKVKYRADRGGSPAFARGDAAFAIARGEETAPGERPQAFCVFKLCGCEGGHASFLLACGETKEECAQAVRNSRLDPRLCDTGPADANAERMLAAILFGAPPCERASLPDIKVNDLWRVGISGDLPLFAVRAGKPAPENTRGMVNAFTSLARAGVRCDLVFLTDDGEKYGRPSETAVYKAISECGAAGYIGAKGGIYVLRERALPPDTRAAILAAASARCDTSRSALFPETESEPPDGAICVPEPGESGKNARLCGRGYFDEESYVVEKSVPPEAPYSYVLAGRRFGCVLDHGGLGLTFFDNSRERRLFAFGGDEAASSGGEKLLLSFGGAEYDVCACAKTVRYGNGRAVYRGKADGADYELEVFVCEKYPIKLMCLKCERAASARYAVRPSMGSGTVAARGVFYTREKRGGNACALFRAPFSQTFAEGTGFIGACGGKAGNGLCVCAEGTEMLFFCGACLTAGGAEAVCALPDAKFYAGQRRLAEIFAQSFLPTMRFESGAVNEKLLNVFFPYQAAACRFFARGAFYQSGGAYGFRDQLQDCLWLMYSLPSEVRAHILRCCAHQYSDGSVMHWWHTRAENGMNRGIKTKCSDDLLFLPYAVSEYCGLTGDSGLLNVRVRYIASPPLGKNERERYELPVASAERESVYLHCLRAFERAATQGAHGLVLMGSCDWNDAFSLVGEKGVGESVFSTMLYIYAAEKFAPLCEARGDAGSARNLRETAQNYRRALEEHAFFGDRYARAFCDDGSVLGARDGSGECEIDILPQAWAAIIGLDEARVKKALDTAFARLYDGEHKIFRLFAPAFSGDGSVRAGYIRGYPAGVRENGGQYTHGAIWGAIGFLKAGMTERALKVFECADPAKRCATPGGTALYRLEPYAAAGDVYGGKYAGRGGWSWYTGAAAWYCKAAAEELFGVKLRGGALEVKPKVPFSAQLRFGDSEICVRCDGKGGVPLLDGRPAEMPFALTPGSHTLILPFCG
ncbi:MAG: hypothetical protein IJQ53_03445 [Clostridia bacterium]|nr:hypothetical protein [Clostridia bacterium]